MDYAPQYRLDPLPRSFAADAHGCIMVGSLRIYRIQGCGAIIERPMASSPRFVCIIRKAVCSDSWCLTSKAPYKGPADVAEARNYSGENQCTKPKVGLRASTGRPKSMMSGLPMPAASALANGPSSIAARGWRKCAIGSSPQAAASLKTSMLRSRFRMALSSRRSSIAGSRSIHQSEAARPLSRPLLACRRQGRQPGRRDPVFFS